MKIILFGAGTNAISFLQKNPICKKVDIIKIIDNNKSKWGKKINEFDYIIESPDKISQLEFDYIVVTPKESEIIKKQLIEDYKIPEEKIIGCGDLFIPDESNLGTLDIDCDKGRVYLIDKMIPNHVITSNKMEEFYFKHKHNVMNKWWHYFEIYQQYFGKYVGANVKMLEIGVFKGGSMQMWQDFFGTNAQIVGVDIDERCKSYEKDNVHICIGSQADSNFLTEVSNKFGPFDIILDDGSHIMNHQIITFETLFPLLKNGGIYMCEDCHTSYWSEYDGGYLKKDSFIEYSKGFIDCVNGQYFKKDQTNTEIDDYIKACHYYDSMVVVEKKKRGYSIVTEFSKL